MIPGYHHKHVISSIVNIYLMFLSCRKKEHNTIIQLIYKPKKCYQGFVQQNYWGMGALISWLGSYIWIILLRIYLVKLMLKGYERLQLEIIVF